MPVLPTVANQSQSLKDAIALAASAFGPDHWSVRAELHYYDVDRGYWIYYRNQERLDDGKTWEFSPIAVIVKSSKGRELKTITGDKARINFNRPFDVSKPGDEPAYVTHALIQGNVRIRADKGTRDHRRRPRDRPAELPGIRRESGPDHLAGGRADRARREGHDRHGPGPDDGPAPQAARDRPLAVTAEGTARAGRRGGRLRGREDDHSCTAT